MAELATRIKDVVRRVDGIGDIEVDSWNGLDDRTKQSVYRAVAEDLVDRDPKTVAAYLASPEWADQLSSETARDVLREWCDRAYLGDLKRDLERDGGPSKGAVLKAIDACGGKAPNAEVRGLLGAVWSPEIDAPIDKSKLLAWLGDAGVDGEFVAALDSALGDGDLTTNEVLGVVASWLAGADADRLMELIGAVGDMGPAEVLRRVVLDMLPEQLAALVKKMLNDDWLGLAAEVLGVFELDLAKDLLQALREGGETLRGFAIKQVTKLLDDRGVGEPGVIARANVEIIKGVRSFFASVPEVGSPLSRPPDTLLWREIKTVLYYVHRSLALPSASVVSPGAQGRPNVLTWGAIRWETPLKKLVPKGKDRLFCNYLTRYVDVCFRGRMVPYGNRLILQVHQLDGPCG